IARSHIRVAADTHEIHLVGFQRAQLFVEGRSQRGFVTAGIARVETNQLGQELAGAHGRAIIRANRRSASRKMSSASSTSAIAYPKSALGPTYHAKRACAPPNTNSASWLPKTVTRIRPLAPRCRGSENGRSF